MVQTSGQAFAATWRTGEDQVIGTTWGGTVCWDPIKPWRIRIERDGYQHVVPCRKCPGCLEFLRRRLAQRLSAKYRTQGPALGPSCKGERGGVRCLEGLPPSSLFFIRIYAPRDEHAAISHRMHRIAALELEPGMYRLGTTSFGVIARSRVLIPLYLRSRGLEHRVEPIRLRPLSRNALARLDRGEEISPRERNRGLRAWRKVTAGLLVAREAYGENVNRWYVHGLPAAEGENWDVVKVATYRAYSRWSSPRAWKQGNLTLVPPEVWRMRRIDRRKFAQMMSHAGSPESAHAVAQLVSKLATSIGKAQSPLTAPEGLSTREATQAWYREMARKKQARTTDSEGSKDIPPLLREGGYSSSVHSHGELLPKILTDDELLAIGPSGKPRWMEQEKATEGAWQQHEQRRRETARRKLEEALESLREKMTRRK